MRCCSTIRDVRLIDKGSPAAFPKVPGSVYVGMLRVPACSTEELALRGAIGFCGMAVLGASSTGVFGVHKHNPDASLLSLVLNKRSQLRECPTMQSGPLFASNRDPQTNVLEVFQSNRPLRALRLRNDLLRYYVVDIFRQTLLLPREISESALRRFRCYLWQLSPQSPISMTDVFHGRPAVLLVIGIGRQVPDSQVYAQRVSDILLCRALLVARSSEIKLAADPTLLAALSAFPFGARRPIGDL